MMNDLFDLRSLLDPVWVERYRRFLPEAEAWWNDPRNEKSRFGVDSSTVRALSTGATGDSGPLAIYEDWAAEQLGNLVQDKESWKQLLTFHGFEHWHATLTSSLVAHWQTKSGKELSIAHRYKLVDLFTRWIRVRAPAGSVLREAILRCAHIPLDKKSIATISAMFSDIALSPTFSMGLVRSEKGYRTYQRLARIIAEEVGGSPVLLDVFAWNSEDAKKLY